MLIKKLGIKNIKDLIDYLYYRIYYGIRKAGFKDAEIPAVGYTSLIVSFLIASFTKEIFIDCLGVYNFFKIKSIRMGYGLFFYIIYSMYFLMKGRYKNIEERYKNIEEEIKKKADIGVVIFLIFFTIYFFYHMAVD